MVDLTTVIYEAESKIKEKYWPQTNRPHKTEQDNSLKKPGVIKDSCDSHLPLRKQLYSSWLF